MNCTRPGSHTVRLSACVGLWLLAAVLRAQSYEIVHVLSGSTGHPTGQLAQTSDGSMLGTTERGGRFGKGSIFRLVPDGLGGFANVELHSFSGIDGQGPHGGVIAASDGQYYGTTTRGGSFGGGTLYRLDRLGRVTTLHHFDTTNGTFPMGELVEHGGLLYGTTSSQGPGFSGSIFTSDLVGGFAVVYAFTGAAGASPNSGLTTGPDGLLYGVASSGGSTNGGVVFRLEADGSVTDLHDFVADTDGFDPVGGLTLGSDGFLYGTAAGAGPGGSGTVFRIDPLGTFTMLHGLIPSEASTPVAPLFEASPGVFVGSGSFGGTTNDGTLFRYETATTTLTRIHAFSTIDGEYPYSGVIRASDGSLYGSTSAGGATGLGEVYRTDVDGNVESVATFSNFEGSHPVAGLYQADDGKIYGADAQDGQYGFGAAFRIDASDLFEVLHSFVPAEGTGVAAPMTQGSDGALYGLASANGAGGFGALFRIDPATSAFSIVHDFDGAGGKTPIAGLLPLADFLYGTTNEGGVNSQGTLFRIDTAGVFENLWDFTGTEGAAPRNALIAGSDGLLYGGAYGGGATGDGSLFHYDSGAGVVSFHDFQPSEGQHAGPLVEVSNGIFDGTTTAGGAHDAGTLYQTDAAGTVSVLHDFGSAQDDGTHPSGRIVLATDGRVYGTTERGASPDLGSIYRFDGATLEIVQIFEPESGVYPFGGLTQAADGGLYGTTFSGGLSDRGVVYRLFPETAQPSVTAIVPSSGAGQGGTSVAVQGTHFHPAASLSIGGIAGLRVDEDSRSLLGVAPALTPGALYDVTVLNPAAMSTLEKAWFADFLDVDSGNIFHDDVEAIVRAGITAGCGGGNYCVNAAVTRAQMAVFLLKAKLGAGHVPPPATGTVFADVPLGSFADAWIEELASLGITGGCGGADYCPGFPVTRAQMAIFLLKTSLGSGYAPPVVAQIFDDVAPGAFAADWINDLSGRGITGGCSANPLLYCPANSSTRGQMAVFMTKTFLAP